MIIERFGRPRSAPLAAEVKRTALAFAADLQAEKEQCTFDLGIACSSQKSRTALLILSQLMYDSTDDAKLKCFGNETVGSWNFLECCHDPFLPFF